MPSLEELELAREIRRQFAKLPIDSKQLEIQVIRGKVYLGGKLGTIKGVDGVDLKSVVADITERLAKMPKIKQVILETRYFDANEKAKKHDGEAGHGKH